MAKISDTFSVGIIFFFGFLCNFLSKIKVPNIIGMIIIGIIIGPEVLKLISDNINTISSELRSIALVIIFTRTGLNLDFSTLKKIGRPSILLAFIPSIFEIFGETLASIWLLKLNTFESMLLGSVIAPISPAVVSVRMLNLIEKRYGEKNNVPKIILAGSSIDDIFVIILFYAFIPLAESSDFEPKTLLAIPISIILGIILGLIIGIIIIFVLKKTNFDDYINLLLIFSVTLLMKGLESYIDEITKGTNVNYMSISGLLGIIVLGILILYKNPIKCKQLSSNYNYIWKFFEIIVFITVGANLKFTKEVINNIGYSICVILIGLVFRSIGVFLCLIKTGLSIKEKIFCIISYIPKATVQASIGGIPLSRGLKCGDLVLSVSIISIILAGSVGALLIDLLGYKLLENENKEDKNIDNCQNEKENINKNENKFIDNSDNIQENIIKSEDNKIVNESDKLNINNNKQIK